jgi:hypothetical protein
MPVPAAGHVRIRLARECVLPGAAGPAQAVIDMARAGKCGRANREIVWEDSVSLMTRKHPVDNVVGVRDRAVKGAQRAVPAAKKAVPLAKNASVAVVRSAEDAAAWAKPRVDDAAAWAKPRVDDAAAWAKPHVDDARAWAAPRLERSGVAVQETLAPAISEAIVSAARKLDVKPARKRRRWATVLAVSMLLAAAGSAAAAVALRRRPSVVGYEPADQGSADVSTSAADQHVTADGSQPDVEVNGQSPEV